MMIYCIIFSVVKKNLQNLAEFFLDLSQMIGASSIPQQYIEFFKHH